MKSIRLSDVAVPEDATTAKTRAKVCIHVLRDACTDVRVIRAGSALIEEGFDVSVVDVQHEPFCPVQEDMHGIKLKHLLIPTWYTARRSEVQFFVTAVWTFILSVLRLIREHADIYHANELTALPACYLVSRLLRKPLIFEIYDLQFPVPYTQIAFWRRVGAYLYSLLLPRCAGVIVTSPFHAREIANRYQVPAMTLARNVPPYRTVQKNDRLREHFGLSATTRIALYQGNIQSDRGLDVLVHAASFLERDSVIVIKGTGSDQAWLETLILDAGVADRIKVMSPVPYEEMLDWTASADIGLIVHPPDFSLNVQTLLPNKFFEYLMAGLPVLTSEIEAVVDVVKTYDVGQIIHSLTPSGVGTAINAMLADRDALVRMRSNALEVAKREFNWEKEAQQLLCLYRGLLIRQNPSQS